MNGRNIRKLFPVGRKEWLNSRGCPIKEGIWKAAHATYPSANVRKALLNAYPHYQKWFVREGYKLKGGAAQGKYLLLISPPGQTALPKGVVYEMERRAIVSLHELLLMYSYTQMRMRDIVSEGEWRAFINLLHDNNCYNLLKIS